MDGHEPQDEEKVSHCRTGLAERRCAITPAIVRGLLIPSLVDRFSSGKIGTRDESPRVQPVPIPLY